MDVLSTVYIRDKLKLWNAEIDVADKNNFKTSYHISEYAYVKSATSYTIGAECRGNYIL